MNTHTYMAKQQQATQVFMFRSCSLRQNKVLI